MPETFEELFFAAISCLKIDRRLSQTSLAKSRPVIRPVALVVAPLIAARTASGSGCKEKKTIA
jgi:hypothetical protein